MSSTRRGDRKRARYAAESMYIRDTRGGRFHSGDLFRCQTRPFWRSDLVGEMFVTEEISWMVERDSDASAN